MKIEKQILKAPTKPQKTKTTTSTKSAGSATINLPKNHPLFKVASAIATDWNDNNIMDGLAKIDVGRIQSRDFLVPIAIDMLKKAYKDEEQKSLPASKISSQMLTGDGSIKMATKIVAQDGFCFSPENTADTQAIQKDIKKMLAAAGDGKKLVCAVAKAVAQTSAHADDVAHHIFLFVNTQTGLFVEIFVRQGSM